MIIHMLNQKGNTDLLSAPKVTTKSGQQATIKVVTEYIYPTDFEVTPITATSGGGAGAASIVGGIVQPGGFQTREVGVLLEVLPEVSTEGQLINLTLTPQVVGDPEWRNYGSTYTDQDGNIQQLPMEQPFFKVRTVTTSLSIYNGATVVLGGMITEHRNDVDDKIPFFGDIPVLGRLFRSKYNHSSKRNLLIFVTARLVDPAGRELKSIESKIEALAGAAGAGGPQATIAP
jgi:general secretion pathway protein D